LKRLLGTNAAYRFVSLELRAFSYLVLIGTLVVGCSGPHARVEHETLSPGILTSDVSVETTPSTCSELGLFVAGELGGLISRSTGPVGDSFILQYRPAVLEMCTRSRETVLLKVIGNRKEVEGRAATDSWVMKLPRAVSEKGPNMSDEFLHYLSMSSGAIKDIVEIVGQDTIPCAFLHVETTPSVGPYHHVLIGFDTPQDSQQRKLIWHDRVGLLGGEVQFEFPNGVFAKYQTIVTRSMSN